MPIDRGPWVPIETGRCGPNCGTETVISTIRRRGQSKQDWSDPLDFHAGPTFASFDGIAPGAFASIADDIDRNAVVWVSDEPRGPRPRFNPIPYLGPIQDMLEEIERLGDHGKAVPTLTPQDILMPGGVPVGKKLPGAGTEIRTVSAADLESIIAHLKWLGVVPVPRTGYPGQWYNFANHVGGFGVRNSGRFGKTLDLGGIPGLEFNKLHGLP